MQTGTVLMNRYRLEHKLGHGGMGSVYAATDLALGRSVALKLVHLDGVNLAERLSRFALEARAIAALTHPHVGALYDFQPEMNPAPFLVMEHIEGETLRALLNRERQLSVGRAITLAKQMLAGLGAAHARGMIHRDIKPGNVMLARAIGVAETVKLVDFGIAKIAGAQADHSTDRATMIGTLQYMAPEQATTDEIDHRADLYSVALVLYEMLAGYNPFKVGDTIAVLRAMRSLEPPPLDRVRPDVPPALAAVLARALAKHPDHRFGSAGELDAALSHALGSLSRLPASGYLPPVPSSQPSSLGYAATANAPRTSVTTHTTVDATRSAPEPLRETKWPIWIAVFGTAVIALSYVVMLSFGGARSSKPSSLDPSTAAELAFFERCEALVKADKYQEIRDTICPIAFTGTNSMALNYCDTACEKLEDSPCLLKLKHVRERAHGAPGSY